MHSPPGPGRLVRRFRASSVLDRVVTAWSCLLAPPLSLVASVLALLGTAPWTLPALLFASVIAPPLLLAPAPPVAPAGALDETLRGRVHAAVHDEPEDEAAPV